MRETIRVLIADDHPLVREGLRGLISAETDMELVGEAANGAEAVEKAAGLDPDVILLDLLMPVKSGLEAIIEIKQHNPDARILVVTSFAEDEQIFPALKAGALGYLLKDASHRELLQAVRKYGRVSRRYTRPSPGGWSASLTSPPLARVWRHFSSNGRWKC